MRKFRKAGTPKLSDEEKIRQSDAVRAAQAAFADLDMVRAFLNTHHPELGGRPLDLAVESPTGLEAVRATIQSARQAPEQSA